MNVNRSSGSVPVAIINNSITPYRIHLHRRLANEMPDLEIWSLFTHDTSNAPWALRPPSEIRPIFFGAGEHSVRQDHLLSQWREWRKAAAILQWIREHGIRAVVLGGYNDAGRLRILNSCRKSGVPCFLFGDSNARCERAPAWKHVMKRAILPKVLGLASGVLCCGTWGEEYFRNYGFARSRIFQFPYEPDYSRIGAIADSEVDAARAEFGLRADRRYLMYSGRLAPEKRVDLLLKAFSEIAGSRPHWNLIIAGDGPLRASLERMISAGLVERVIWTGFINEPDKLHSLYGAADVLVLPSDYEPWGVVVTEAAVRIPVVASSMVGAAADLITDGVNGKIFGCGDVKALREALLEVTQPDTLRRMTASAQGMFEQWHARFDPVRGLRAALDSVSLAPICERAAS